MAALTKHPTIEELIAPGGIGDMIAKEADRRGFNCATICRSCGEQLEGVQAMVDHRRKCS